MSNEFLPEDYELPKGDGSQFMKLDEEGQYRIRIMTPAKIGWEWWDKSTEKAKVFRVRNEAEVPEAVKKVKDKRNRAKEFWGFIVYNYNAEAFQLLTITQATIKKALMGLLDDADFGKDITSYDVKVTRDDSSGRTVYSVQAAPPKPLTDELKELYKDFDLDLEKSLFGEKSEEAPAKKEPVADAANPPV